MIEHVVYFVTADGRSSRPFDDYFDALDALTLITNTDPELRAELVATQPSGAHVFLRMPLLKPSEEDQ